MDETALPDGAEKDWDAAPMKKNSTVSVIMATWNGTGYIGEQLDSLRRQTRQPEEVLIFDDCSADGTAEYIQEYISEYDLRNWNIQVNEINLGWKRNFVQAMKQAKGELIFLCDQDDIWYPEKIQEMTAAMQDRPEILVLACDYQVVYRDGAIRAKVYRKRGIEKRSEVAPYRFTRNFFKNPNPGCSFVIRKSFLNQVIDLWFAEAPHDEFLWLMAAMRDGAFFLNRKLMDYIRYGGNSSDIRYKDIPAQQKNLEYISHMLTIMADYGIRNADQVTEQKAALIREAKTWCGKRKKLMETGNPVRWLLMMPWWGFYNSFANCLSDLYLVLFGSFRRS